jgi:hypothetical protein
MDGRESIRRNISGQPSCLDRAIDIARELGCRSGADAAGNYQCRCPGRLHRHADRHASLSVKDGRNGRPVLYCFAGCSYDEIAAALEARGLRV